ncbi:MAG: IclR family transcriptional regulator [Oscillibacter sp.]|nr:IclR family transcriptional regulator [Oscillibacter sp.]
MTGREPGKVQSVCKAMELLSCLGHAREPLSLGELSARTGIPKATAHGLLASMRLYAVVEQSAEDGKYRLGIRLFEYGCLVSRGWNILEAAAEPMNRVARETGETVSVSALDRGEVLVLDCADAHSDLRVVSEKGARLPLHCTSQGKLLLAYLPESRRKSLLRSCDFAAYTPHGHTNAVSLEAEVPKILARGYAIEDGEYRIGLRSVSAPVFDVSGQVAYAVCVVGMFRRINSPELERAAELLLEAAEQISFALGYRGVYGKDSRHAAN